MASDNPVPPGDGELARKMDEINRKLDAVGSANMRTKIVSLVLALAIIGVGVYGVFKVSSPFQKAYDEPQKYVEAITAEMEERVLPILQAEGKLLQEKAQPFIIETIQTKFEARQDEIASAAHNQLTTMIDEMKEFAEGEFTTRRDRIEGAILDRVKTEVPELADEANTEIIMVNAQKAMSAAVERIMADHMHSHVESIANIGTRFEMFPIPADLKAMSEDELREELTSALGQYAAGAFRHSLAPQTRAQIRQFTEAE